MDETKDYFNISINYLISQKKSKFTYPIASADIFGCCIIDKVVRNLDKSTVFSNFLKPK